MKTRLYLLIAFALLALSLTGCDQINKVAAAEATPSAQPDVSAPAHSDGSVVVEGNIVPRDYSRIYTRSGGKVAEVLAKKGDLVQKDAVLVRFGDREQTEAALSSAKLEQVNAQTALDKLNEKAPVSASQALITLDNAKKALIDAQQKLDDQDDDQYQTDLDNAKTDAATAQKELEDAQKEWDKYKDLDPANQTRKTQKTTFDNAQKKYDDAVRKRDLKINEMDQLKSAVSQAQAAVDDAQREYDKRKNNQPASDDLAQAQARLDNAKAQVSAAQNALDSLEVKAPFDGTVVELEVVPGDILLPSQQIVLLADLSELYVETNDLTEMDVVKVAISQPAKVKPDALTDLSLPATVTEIARSSGKKGGDVTYTVRLKLDESDPRLRWGMTVEVRFSEK